MNRTILAAALATALAASGSVSAADTTLTVYSGDFDSVSQSEGQPGSSGFALVNRKLGFDLKNGDNAVSLGGLPRALDASSVLLKPTGSASVRGQRFDFAVAGQDELLRRAVGQTVTVEQAVGNERQAYTGTLISAGNGLTLRLADGRIKVLSGYSSFELPRMPDGVVNEPTMNWSLASDHAGHQDFGLSYATAGLAWRAEYNVNANGQGKDCRMSLEGAAMVVNRSGADFNDVMLTLVAGEPNRQPEAGPQVMMARAAPSPKMVLADSAPEAQASGEYQAYKLPNAGSLPQGSVQRLPLVNSASNISCERRYETSAQIGDWMPPYPIIDANYGAGDGQQQPVIATLRFKNSKASGLGVPLPAGRVRMFDGSDFLGEASLDHTAVNEDVALAIGNVFDLSAERTREDFQLDRDGRTMTETVLVTLKNAKATAATVRVTERLPRWTGWEMVSSSVAFDKRNAQTVSFDVPVVAGGEAKLRYTVRYRWAAEVKIP
jgi:hypothetical protein